MIIEFHLQFKMEQDIEAGWFIDLLNQESDGTQNLQLHFGRGVGGAV